jgi:hypothetical protein
VFPAYFTRGDYNIIIVDYSTLVKEPCLSQINWAPRFGAKCIAQLVDYLSNHPRGVPPDALHLIGYSVGAHIAGLVANYLNKGKLGRITGENVYLVPSVRLVTLLRCTESRGEPTECLDTFG